MFVQLPSARAVLRATRVLSQGHSRGTWTGWGQVTLEQQCLSPLWVGQLGHGVGLGFSIKYLPQRRAVPSLEWGRPILGC